MEDRVIVQIDENILKEANIVKRLYFTPGNNNLLKNSSVLNSSCISFTTGIIIFFIFRILID